MYILNKVNTHTHIEIISISIKSYTQHTARCTIFLIVRIIFTKYENTEMKTMKTVNKLQNYTQINI